MTHTTPAQFSQAEIDSMPESVKDAVVRATEARLARDFPNAFAPTKVRLTTRQAEQAMRAAKTSRFVTHG